MRGSCVGVRGSCVGVRGSCVCVRGSCVGVRGSWVSPHLEDVHVDPAPEHPAGGLGGGRPGISPGVNIKMNKILTFYERESLIERIRIFW